MPTARLSDSDLKNFLDQKVEQYNRPAFITNDPVSIPHQFSKKQDIEIAALFAAVLAWGQRITIIRNCQWLMERMNHSPHEFLLHHRRADLKPFHDFKHRTFNGVDLLYFIRFLRHHYETHDSLEELFVTGGSELTVERALINFYNAFFSLTGFPKRTRKHIATPDRKSACKRINMYLRWMVRQDNKGVDFGIWKNLSPATLICPVDLHVERVARKLKLIKRKQVDWQTALELTARLKQFDPADPVKYDFALFGLGIEEGF
jgi:uncharacterized protein (TIGR02757 family)